MNKTLCNLQIYYLFRDKSKMVFPESLIKRVYCDDIPIHINERFNNIFCYNKPLKILNVLKNNECNITIKNINAMYYKDDIFYIISKLYMLIIWEDVKQWKIIKRV